MNKTLRDAMFIFFVVLFCVITFLLSLYAAGYRLDLGRALKGQFLQKTGMLILDSAPKGASIYLDGNQAKTSGSIFGSYAVTPAKIKNLLPKEYDVIVKMDGYWPWEKKLTVYGGQSTYAENIILFKRCTPTDAAQTQAESCAANLDGSVKDAAILQALTSKIGQSAKIKTEDNSLFFFGTADRINSYNQRNDETATVLDGQASGEKYLDYLPKGGKLLVVAKNGERIELRSYELKNNSLVQKINLPSAWNYQLSASEGNIIAAYNPDSRSLLLFDGSSLQPLGAPIGNASNWSWVSGTQLLVAGDFEITSYDLANNNRQLVTRVSEEISGLVWNKKKKYLIYTTAKSINSIDLYEWSGKITKLLDGKNISQPSLDEKTNTLYFQAADANGALSWQKIELQ